MARDRQATLVSRAIRVPLVIRAGRVLLARPDGRVTQDPQARPVTRVGLDGRVTQDRRAKQARQAGRDRPAQQDWVDPRHMIGHLSKQFNLSISSKIFKPNLLEARIRGWTERSLSRNSRVHLSLPLQFPKTTRSLWLVSLKIRLLSQICSKICNMQFFAVMVALCNCTRVQLPCSLAHMLPMISFKLFRMASTFDSSKTGLKFIRTNHRVLDRRPCSSKSICPRQVQL